MCFGIEFMVLLFFFLGFYDVDKQGKRNKRKRREKNNNQFIDINSYESEIGNCVLFFPFVVKQISRYASASLAKTHTRSEAFQQTQGVLKEITKSMN